MRTITYNVYKWRCWPQGADPAERCKVSSLNDNTAIDLFVEAIGKYKPDVITLTESFSLGSSFSESSSSKRSPDSIVHGIADRLNMNVAIFASEGSMGPGALLTRFDILDSVNCPLVNTKKKTPELFTRHWGRAVLSTNKGKLIVYSAHLCPLLCPEEIDEAIAVMKDDLKSGSSVLFQGDLNHEPEDSPYNQWKRIGLVDTFEAAGTGQGETCRADKPDSRIDYIFAYGQILEHLLECRVVHDTWFEVSPDYANKGKIYYLSDHLPVMATFK